MTKKTRKKYEHSTQTCKQCGIEKVNSRFGYDNYANGKLLKKEICKCCESIKPKL